MGALFVAPKVHMASRIAKKLGCAFDDGPLGPHPAGRQEMDPGAGVFAAGDAGSPMHTPRSPQPPAFWREWALMVHCAGKM